MNVAASPRRNLTHGRDEEDRRGILVRLGEALTWGKIGWQVQGLGPMPDRFHLVVETLRGRWMAGQVSEHEVVRSARPPQALFSAPWGKRRSVARVARRRGGRRTIAPDARRVRQPRDGRAPQSTGPGATPAMSMPDCRKARVCNRHDNLPASR